MDETCPLEVQGTFALATKSGPQLYPAQKKLQSEMGNEVRDDSTTFTASLM